MVKLTWFTRILLATFCLAALLSSAGAAAPGAHAAATAAARPLAGQLDLSFAPGSGTCSNCAAVDSPVNAIALQDDHKIVLAGDFTSYNGTNRRNLARANADGSLDTTFNASGAMPHNPAAVDAVDIQRSDGKIVFGDSHAVNYNGLNHWGVQRVSGAGALDSTFDASSTGFQGTVYVVAVQPDHTILVGGSFDLVDGVGCHNIARLKADGSRDPAFSGPCDPNLGPDDTVSAIAVQPTDGKILIGGGFSHVNGTLRHRVARLNTDGSLDTSFDPGTPDSVSDYIRAIAVQPDGKVLMAGSIGSYGSAETPVIGEIVRVNANGTLDPSFDINEGVNNPILTIALQPDGKVLIAGDFDAYEAADRIDRPHLARLKADGTLDPTFDPGAGTDGSILAMALQPDGKVVIAGSFITYDNVPRSHIARIDGDAHAYLPLARK